MKLFSSLAVAAMALSSLITYDVSAGEIFDEVRQRGHIRCGISDGLPGFSQADGEGHYSGFDVDICRAVAAAVFGDADRVEYTPLTARERFAALGSDKIDLLSRNTTWTSHRDSAMDLNFAGIAYYDGQGFLVNKASDTDSARELEDTRICLQGGTTTELNLKDYLEAGGMAYTPVVFDTAKASAKALEAGRCDALTADQSHLYALRITLAKPENYRVLPEVISKEPLGPAVRHGDDAWYDVIKWTLFALINAEELQVNSSNVDQQLQSNNPAIKRLLGVTGNQGQNLGLSAEWALHIIRQVGNYGEIFERNLGQDSPLRIGRGLNALWTQGGLHYAPPIR